MELKFRCCFTSREIKRTIRDRDPMTAASTFTLLLTSDKMWKEHSAKYRRQVWKMIPFSSTCHKHWVVATRLCIDRELLSCEDGLLPAL